MGKHSSLLYFEKKFVECTAGACLLRFPCVAPLLLVCPEKIARDKHSSLLYFEKKFVEYTAGACLLKNPCTAPLW
jgi:hypothetical protein